MKTLYGFDPHSLSKEEINTFFLYEEGLDEKIIRNLGFLRIIFMNGLQFKTRQDFLKANFTCDVCKGKGYYNKFLGYEEILVGSRKVLRGTLMPRMVIEPCFEQEPQYESITCPACGGRGYDLEAVVISQTTDYFAKIRELYRFKKERNLIDF